MGCPRLSTTSVERKVAWRRRQGMAVRPHDPSAAAKQAAGRPRVYSDPAGAPHASTGGSVLGAVRTDRRVQPGRGHATPGPGRPLLRARSRRERPLLWGGRGARAPASAGAPTPGARQGYARSSRGRAERSKRRQRTGVCGSAPIVLQETADSTLLHHRRVGKTAWHHPVTACHPRHPMRLHVRLAMSAGWITRHQPQAVAALQEAPGVRKARHGAHQLRRTDTAGWQSASGG
jgi:hypothetical protein